MSDEAQRLRELPLQDGLERIDSDNDDYDVSFHCDETVDGLAVTQHRYYRWGDCLIAIGELNHPNHWDDDAFDAKCAALESALRAAMKDSSNG